MPLKTVGWKGCCQVQCGHCGRRVTTYTGGYEGKVCPKCREANFNLVHIARCEHNDPIFSTIERVISIIEAAADDKRPPFADPNPISDWNVSALTRKRLIGQRILAYQYMDQSNLTKAKVLSRAGTALYQFT